MLVVLLIEDEIVPEATLVADLGCDWATHELNLQAVTYSVALFEAAHF